MFGPVLSHQLRTIEMKGRQSMIWLKLIENRYAIVGVRQLEPRYTASTHIRDHICKAILLEKGMRGALGAMVVENTQTLLDGIQRIPRGGRHVREPGVNESIDQNIIVFVSKRYTV